MPAQRGHTKGKPRHRKPDAGTKCQLGRIAHPTRRKAEEASPSGKAERCGRCRQWHAVEDRGSGRRR